MVPRRDWGDHAVDVIDSDRLLDCQSEWLHRHLGARLHVIDPLGKWDTVQPAKQAGHTKQ